MGQLIAACITAAAVIVTLADYDTRRAEANPPPVDPPGYVDDEPETWAGR